ncbi:sodium:solute symporter [Paenalcaligenes sp. Me131]|uniref:sodium:solute symporter n=1 Tax=Paenalcaligenes sp. Me131 TaxID=3392636 RepID=UPI003D2C4739
MEVSIDLGVVILYALLILSFGWIGMRRIKNKDDFLVAGRNLGSGFYTGTMAATVLGGAATIGSVRLGYLYGISGLWLCATLGLGIMGLSWLLAKPLLRLRVYTVTQVLERYYSPATRNASAVIMLVYALMIGVTSTIATGTILAVIFDLPFITGIILGGGLVVLYATIGGMWSLTLTDMIQFIIMTVGLVFILLPASVYNAGGWSAMTQQLPDAFFSFSNIGYDTILTYFLIYFLGVFIGQDIWQRVFTARSEKVAKRAGMLSGLYCILYGIAMAVIGMAARLVLPELDAPDTAFAAMINEVLPVGLRGLVIAASLAALMSTASAGLLAASTTVAQDLWPLLRGKHHRDSDSVTLNRVFTLLFGLLMLAIAPTIGDVISALTMAYNLLVGGMLIPLIGGIFWKRATTRGAIVSMATGAITASVFMLKDGLLANTPIYFSLSIGLITFIVFSLTDPNPRRTSVVPTPSPVSGE